MTDEDFVLEGGIGAADLAGATAGVGEVGAGGEGEGEAEGKDEGGGMTGAAGGEIGCGGEDDGPAAFADFECGGGIGAQGRVVGWGEGEDAFAVGGAVEEFGAEPGAFEVPEGVADEGLDAEDGDGEAGELAAAVFGVAGQGSIEDGQEDEEAGGMLGVLGEANGSGGDGEAGVAGAFEGGASARIGGEVEAEGGLIGGERFDEVDRDVFGAGAGRPEVAVGIGFEEGEVGEAVGVSGGFEIGALIGADEGIPGEGLEFGLAGEGGLDEGVEVPAIEASMGGVEGVDRMEDFHGAEDGDAEAFDLLVGEVGGGFGEVAVFAVTEVEGEGDGEDEAGDEDTGNPEEGSWQAS